MIQLPLFEVSSNAEFNGIWTDQDILKMQEKMLIEALNEIRDGRKSEAMRQEAIKWLMSESKHPFSADICAENCGYDIERLRSYLLPIINKHYLTISI